jgi:hypothetical protein
VNPALRLAEIVTALEQVGLTVLVPLSSLARGRRDSGQQLPLRDALLSLVGPCLLLFLAAGSGRIRQARNQNLPIFGHEEARHDDAGPL